MADKDYLSIDNPYNGFLERGEENFGLAGSSPTPVGGSAPVQNPGDVDPQSLNGQSFGDLFIENWIRSRNYLPQKRGFYLNARDGYAEFTDVLITGSITATTGTIGGFDIGPDYIRDSTNMFGLSSAVTEGDDVRFWAGASFANRNTAPFRVTEAGVMTATTGTFSGTLSAPGGTLGGFTIGAANLSATASGNTTIVSSGATAFAAGPTGSPTFTVTQAGALTVTNGTITGGTIRTSDGATRVEMDSGDNTLIAYVSNVQRAFFGGLLGAVSVLPAGGVGGGMVSQNNGELIIFAGDPSGGINGNVRIEASNGTTIFADDGSVAALFIDIDQSDGGNAIALKIDVQQSGAGTPYAFHFAGEEVDNSITSVSGLTGAVRVITSDGIVWIPLYNTAS